MRPALLVAVAALVLPFGASGNGAAPPNDLFADAVDLSTTSAARGFVEGTNATASKEPSEPDHAGNAGGHSIWYTWTAPADGSVPNLGIRLFGDFDTLLAVYTGATVDALTEVASNDDVGFGSSAVSFATVAGTTYRIAVDGFAGKMGRFTLSWAIAPANNNFADAIVLGGAAGARRADTIAGATVELAEPDPSGTGLSVWYSWTPPTDGTYKLATFGSTFDTVLAVYEGSSVESLELLRRNDDDPDRGCCSSWVPLVNAQATTTYMIQVTDLSGGGGASRLALQWGPLVLGTRGADALVGTPGAEELRGLGGPDSVSGAGGADLVFGGAGNDVGRGGRGADLIQDTRGTDRLLGGGGADVLNARDFRGNDVLRGGAGDDVCRADRGDVRRRC